MTETGVNRDFNFLTGLEKTITRATEVLPGLVEDGGRKGEGEGDGEEAKRGKRVKMSREAKVHFHQLLKERGTEVKWAPWEGFERAKENFTRVNK